MADVVVTDSVVDHDHGEDGLKDSQCTGNSLAFLHPEPSVVVVVKVDPPNAIKVLVLPCHHIHEYREGFNHADVSA